MEKLNERLRHLPKAKTTHRMGPRWCGFSVDEQRQPLTLAEQSELFTGGGDVEEATTTRAPAAAAAPNELQKAKLIYDETVTPPATPRAAAAEKALQQQQQQQEGAGTGCACTRRPKPAGESHPQCCVVS